MKYSQKAINEMYKRVLDALNVEFTDLPANSDGADAATGLQAQYEIIVGRSGTQSGLSGTAQQGTAERSAARKNIREYLSTLARSAGSIARKKPGFDSNFPAPSGKNDNQLLADARAVAAKAIAHKDDFIRRGLTLDYLESGAEFIEDFETALGTSNEALSSRGAAVGDKEAAYEAADDYFDTLDDFIRNYYRNQPRKLAAWKIASHVERSPRASKTKEEIK